MSFRNTCPDSVRNRIVGVSTVQLAVLDRGRTRLMAGWFRKVDVTMKKINSKNITSIRLVMLMIRLRPFFAVRKFIPGTPLHRWDR